jgi:bifunctional non-homologous end joining protein LigD
MLSNVKPMRCKLVKEPFDRPGWIFEIKWDGFRAIAEISHSEVRLYSRNQRSFTRQFSEVVSSLERLSGRHEAVLDGELVALDGEGKSRFEWLIRRKSGREQVVYLVFDLLYLDGQDLRSLPLLRRKNLLKKLLRSIPNVLYVDHIEEQGKQFFKLAVQRGLEGIVAKDGQSPYVSGVETWYWLKIKNRHFQRKEPIDFHKKQPR